MIPDQEITSDFLIYRKEILKEIEAINTDLQFICMMSSSPNYHYMIKYDRVNKKFVELSYLVMNKETFENDCNTIYL